MPLIFKGKKAIVPGMILDCKSSSNKIYCEKKLLNSIWKIIFSYDSKIVNFFNYNSIKKETKEFEGNCN